MRVSTALYDLAAVVISWGLRGAQPPPQLFYQPCFSKRIDVASSVLYGIAMMNFLTTIWLLRSL